MAQTLDTKGNVIQNGFSTNLTPSQLSNSNIPVSSISPTTPINITPQVEVPPTTYTTPVNNVAIDTTQGKLLAEQQRAEQVASQEAQNARNQTMGIANDISVSQLNNVKDVAGTYAGQGVNTLYNQVQDLNAQAIGLQNEASAIPIQIQQQATGQGVTDRGVAPIQAAKLRENALKALSLGQQYAIASGNYEKAKNYADQLIETKYSAEEARIKSLQTQQDSIDKNILTPAEQKRLEAAKQVTKLQEQEIADAKEQEKSIQNIGMTLRKYGVSDSVVKDVLSSTNIDDAIIKAGNNLRDPKAVLELQALKTDIALKQAQIAKTNREATLSQEPTATEKKEAIKNIASAKASIQAANDKITAVDAALKYTGGIATRVGTNLFTRGDNAKGFIPMVGPALAARGALAEATGEGQQLSGAVHQLTSGLTLQALIEAKANGATFGSLTDGERLMLASAATKLNDWEVKEKQGDQMVGTGYWNIDEKSFKQELKTIQDLSRRALLKSQGTLITTEEQQVLDASFGAPIVTANQYFQ